MRRPGDEEGEPAGGGHAAERLKEFIRERFPNGLPPEESPIDEPPDEEKERDEDLRDKSS